MASAGAGTSERLALKATAEALLDRLDEERLRLLIPVMEFFVRAEEDAEIKGDLQQLRAARFGEMTISVHDAEVVDTRVTIRKRRRAT